MQSAEEPTLVVVTQNAWGAAPLWERRRASLARSIAEARPDVVGLQEIHAAAADDGWGGSQAHQIAEQAGGYRAFFAPGRAKSGGGAEGVALLVRSDVEVLDHETLSLSLDARDPLEGKNQRVVLRARVRRGGLVAQVLVTHLSLSKRARERTLPEIVAFAAEAERRSGSPGAVLLGDFNATPGEPSLTALDGGWVDAWRQMHPGAPGGGGTWPAVAPFRRLDYVFVRPGSGWEIAGCTRMALAGSDHVGLCARIRAGEVEARPA
jgi:endonuclease/exonuclease/phosphatase family metal-dependent hydrolase